jgi:hypothetical protein
VPDNIGLLFRRHLVMFGPRMDLLTSDEPVVRQFLNGRKEGPIGMAEEKDAAQLAAEESDGKPPAELPPIEDQIQPSSGIPRRTQRGEEDGDGKQSDGERRSQAAVKIIESQQAISDTESVPDEDMPTVEQLDEDLIEPNDAERPGRKALGRRRGKGESGSAPVSGTVVDGDDAGRSKSSAKKATKRTTAKKTTKKTAKKSAAGTTKKTTTRKSTARGGTES